jgi:preprotein translocase subunit SecE
VADEPAKPKRRLRAAPETVRERAGRTQEAAGKPKRTHKPRKILAIFAPLKPVGRVLQKFGRRQPMYILGLILLPRYIRNAWRELRQVTWPNRRESLRLTSAVIVFATIFGILIALVDYGLDKVFKKVILKQ